MIACPDRTATRFALAGAIAAAGIALVTAAGTAGERTARDDGRILLAQAAPAGPTTSPVRLVPPGGAQPGSARSEETNRPEPPPTSSSGDARPPDDVGVTATALSDLDTAAVGLIDSSEGGLGISIWNGSKRSLIEKLISKLPARTRSVAARKLAIRLLATRAEAPRGASGGPDLLTSRVSRMVELGEVDAATRLADQISIERTGETLARSAVEALFLQNDNAGACQRVRDFARRSADPYWQRAFAFCLLLSGDTARADIIVDVLAERGEDGAELFSELIETLNGGEPAAVESLPDPAGLDLAMMRAANVALPADVLGSDRPAVLRTVVASPNADLDLRLEAGERAFLYGALSADGLGELYAAVQWPEAELENPVSTAEGGWGPRGRALLLREAAAAESPSMKALILSRAFGLAREKGGQDVFAGASAPVLKSIPPDPALAWFAPEAVSALLATGHVEEARAWLRMIGSGTEPGPQTSQMTARMWALGLLAAPEIESAAVDEQALRKWRDAAYADDGEKARRATVLALTLLEALGVEPGPGRWGELLAEGLPARVPAPNVAWVRALDEASDAGRVGETVLIVLLGLAGANAEPPGPAAIRQAVESLRRIGLKAEARALALETAVVHGL